MGLVEEQPALKCVISVMVVGCIHLVIFRYCYKAHSRQGRRYGLISQYVIKSQGIDSRGAGTLNRVIVLACQATKAGRIDSWAP